MSRQNSIPVDWEKYKKIKMTYYESPVTYLKGVAQNDQFFLNDGTKVSPVNYREINERLRLSHDMEKT